MNANAAAFEITNDLRRLGKGPRQDHRPSSQGEFGVYAGDFRNVVRKYRQRLAQESGEFVYQVGLILLSQNITDCRKIAYELIAGHKAARESLDIKRLEALGRGIDNWACVDGYSCLLVGRAWRENRISDAAILRWSRSDDLWWRRAAVVATVPLNIKSHGGAGDSRRTLMICGKLAGDGEIMIQKAISWALRSLVPWDRYAVIKFVDEHDNTLSAFVRREVQRKIATGKKN